MNSKFHAIFLTSVAGGAIGLSIADTISNGSEGGIGFIAGLLVTFGFLSFLAAVSDSGKSRLENVKSELAQNQTSQSVSQHQEQRVKHTGAEDTSNQTTIDQ